MTRKLVPILVLIVAIATASCNKSKFQTKPSLEVKSYNNVVGPDGIVSVRLEFTDKEGDLSNASDSSFFYQPVLLNQRNVDANDTREYNPVYTRLPKFPEKQSGEIEVRFTYAELYKLIIEHNPEKDKNDTVEVRFAVRDKGGHTSDTVRTGNIVVLVP